MKKPRINIGSIRREQIVEAAVAVIAEQGLQEMSLSEIEKRAGMSRGQLTYYFPAKEDILLAVFDHLLNLMHRRTSGAEGEAGPCQMDGIGWERLRQFLTFFLLQPPRMPEFHSLQYTFLSQIGHRDDFRQRLASLYEEWRAHLASDFATALETRDDRPSVSPRTLATFVQALLHGLAMQRVADPGAYDHREMNDLCLEVLGTYLRPARAAPPRKVRPTVNGANGGGKTRATTRSSRGKP